MPRTLINATTGWIVDAIGWFGFYLLCMALALPGMVLLLRVAPWNAPLSAGPTTAAKPGARARTPP